DCQEYFAHAPGPWVDGPSAPEIPALLSLVDPWLDRSRPDPIPPSFDPCLCLRLCPCSCFHRYNLRRRKPEAHQSVQGGAYLWLARQQTRRGPVETTSGSLEVLAGRGAGAIRRDALCECRKSSGIRRRRQPRPLSGDGPVGEGTRGSSRPARTRVKESP